MKILTYRQKTHPDDQVRKFLSQFTDKRPNESTEKAAELFTAAATKWKIGQEFQKAAVSFEMANKCFKETENPFGQVQVRKSFSGHS